MIRNILSVVLFIGLSVFYFTDGLDKLKIFLTEGGDTVGPAFSLAMAVATAVVAAIAYARWVAGEDED